MKLPAFKITGSSFVNAIGAVVIVYLLVVLGQTVKKNYDMNQQIAALQGQISLLQDQKDALTYSIQYYNTDSFRDRQARSQLGLQLPGENVVVIPSKSPTPSPTPETNSSKSTAPKSNLQQWLDFLSGHTSS